jgi:hypothetical protein
MAEIQPITLVFTDPETIISTNQKANYDQLQEDSNTYMNSINLQLLDGLKWDLLSEEIATLVSIANEQERTIDQKSLIYGKIMIIITAQYLPVVSDYLGDQIAQQAATEDIASDLSSFLADAQNGFNSLADSGSSTDTESQNDFFGGTTAIVGAVSGATNTSLYDYSFTVLLNVYNSDTGQFESTTVSESSILSFLTDTNVWGDVTPLGDDGSSQISTALTDIISIFNTPVDQVVSDSWLNKQLTDIANTTYTWTQVYGSSSDQPCEGDVGSSTCDVGPQNAPLVYTEPNSIQSDLNQATQSVQTVATSTQTVQNFQVQEINQYYGIINSIQQSQQSQNSSIVKNLA